MAVSSKIWEFGTLVVGKLVSCITNQARSHVTQISGSEKQISYLPAHNTLVKILSQVATEDTFNLSENVRSESDSKRVINFNVMVSSSRF